MDRRSILGFSGALLVLLVLPALVSAGYGIQLLNMALIFSILALGFFVLFGLTGIFAVSQVAFWGLGGYAHAILTTRYHWPFLGGLLGAMAVTAVAGLLLGLPTLKLRNQYLTMATIGFAEAVRISANNFDKLTGGPNGIGRIPAPALGSLVLNTPVSKYYLSLVFVVLIVGGLWRLQRSRLGRAMQAVRDDELAAEAMGVHVTRIKVLAFVLSAVAGGIAGSLYAGLSSFVSPDAFTLAVAVQVTAMVMIGGRSAIGGVVAGAFLLTYLPEWLRDFKDWYMAIYGLGLLVILIFLPEGLAGGARRLADRLKRVKRPVENVALGGGGQ
ncbi:MAG TPA: branched-chain amino acid ABC transporter permease [Symbiobacteriaceae bacterium]|jgi:branched-chain amino acid transport system permease protein